MKIICFRFDVDTYLCALKGVPNLIELADKLDVEFTFFFNMGRGASRSAYFKRKRMADNLPHSAKLNNLHKLGIRGFLKTAIVNPYVGKSCPGIINIVNGKGHEVGLHGGRNHGAWMANGSAWKERQINDEVQWGLNELKQAGIQSVTSFSSPGWQGSDTLHKILMDHGIRVVADQHGHDLENVVPLYDGGLYSVPTNMVGEPGGIGYIENKRALGMSDKDIIEHFRLDLGRITRLAVIYDHPYYSGIKALGLLESMIRVAQEFNFTITTMNKLPGLIAP